MKILTTDRIKDIINALNPWYTGRQQDALVAALDEAADQAGDYAYELVQPLMDFRSDIQSPAGADMVGILDTNGYFTGSTVEEALDELYVLTGGGGMGGIIDSIADGDTVNAPSRNAVFDALALKADTSAVSLKANLASPTFTGTPTAPTPLTADDSTQIATTEWVKDQGYTGNLGTVTSVNATGSTGLSITGGPITGSGSLSFALSANLQSWSAVAPSSKADLASPALTGTPTTNGIEIGYRNIPKGTSSLSQGTMCIRTSGFSWTTGIGVAGDTFMIYNDSAAAITITQGAGMTLRLAGTTTTGNRVIAARGVATFWLNSGSEAIVWGNVT